MAHMQKLLTTLVTVLALTNYSAMAANIPVDVGSAANGITDLHSATFDGSLSPCGVGSPSYCSFFGGDTPVGRAVAISPNPTGVDNGVPIGISPTPVAGSFLNLALTSGNTVAQIVGDSTISLPPLALTISSSGTTIATISGAGFVIKASGAAAVNGLGQVEFLVDNAPAPAADFSTLSSVVTSCVGPLCTIVPILSLDMARYRLFLDFDPTFTSFTGSFIGAENSGTRITATLNSAAVVPVPAAGWLLGTALGVLGARRRGKR